MIKRKSLLKIFVIAVFFMAGFHISGIESAFCDDTSSMESASHGCQICQGNHHSAALECKPVLPILTQVNYTFLNPAFFCDQEPSYSFFRPPISA